MIRATQGDMPVIPEPYAPAAAELGIPQEQLLAHLRGHVRSGACCAASPRSCSTAAPASAPTAWASGRFPDDRIMEMGMQMAQFRGISHCYQRPTYADWPYSVFTMAHGRSKEECDAILDSIAEQTGITERSTLYSSTEFKKIRLLYFTDDYRNWERRNAGV